MSSPTVYELNRMVEEWDKRNHRKMRKRGLGLRPCVRAEGGTWLASMATLLGVQVGSVPIDGIPRPAVPYRGLWFVSLPPGVAL